MTLRQEAQDARARGWILTPLRGKVPTITQWPTAPDPTAEQLEAWAAIGNLGVLTGPRSGILVIDVDEVKGGDVAALNLPPTWTAMTGGGGWHLFFRYAGPKIGNSTGKLGPHVDVRCAGGQVVLVGSKHPDTGRLYEWADGLAPGDLPMADVPAHILERLLPKPSPPRPTYTPGTNGGGDPYARAALDRECARVASAPEGTRNDVLNSASFNLGTLVGGGMLLHAHVESELQQAAAAAGLDFQESAATIRSGMAAGERDPRRPPERHTSPPRRSDARPGPTPLPPEETSTPAAIDLYHASVIPAHPSFTVEHLFRTSGLHLIWSQPSGGKTWTLLRWMIEMLSPVQDGAPTLTGHPDLHIRQRYRKVLWIGTEEDAPGLRAKADQVCMGLGIQAPGGPLLHMWASAPGMRVTLDLLPAILERYGPLDAVVLDSLTGLRPKTVGGVKVKWDLDNDAANDQCLELRGLAVTHNIAIHLVHHTGRETEKGYRGPTEYWASADVMFGLVPDRDAGKTKVLLQKNRDGRILEPFHLTPNWGPDGFFLDYSGSAVQTTDSSAAVLAYLRGCGTASQVQIVQATGLNRRTVIRCLASLVAQGLIRNTGNSVGRSPIFSTT